MKAIAFLFLFALILTSCNLMPAAQPPTPEAPPTSTATPTLPPPQVLSPTPQPTDTPEPTATVTPSPTPFTPFEAAVNVDQVNVRSGPGYLFRVNVNVSEGTVFTILGQAPGGEWLYVETSTGMNGWVFTQLFDLPVPLEDLPLIQPENVTLITGRVQDAQSQPVSGIQYYLTQGEGLRERRTDAMTDESGIFYAFMPLGESGSWKVVYTAVACTSNTMDAECNCLGGVCGTSDPLETTITLPWDDPLLFTWK
jgi:hypothetical protein